MLPFYEHQARDFLIFESKRLTFPSHLHSQLELLYVEQGQIDVTVNQRMETLGPGDFSIAFPNSVHSYRTDHAEAAKLFVVICDPQYTGEYRNSILKSHPADPFVRAQDLHRDIAYAMRTLLDDSRQPDKSESVSRILVQLILARLMPRLDMVKNTDANYFDLTYRAVNYITQNYRSPITLEQLARELGISKFQLSRMFSHRLNTSYNEYINHMRVNCAQELLRSTDLPVTSICFDCGFESQRTFNRAFQQLCDMTPREYRNANKSSLASGRRPE